MKTRIIEAKQTGDPANWGKFMVMRPDEEWARRSAIDDNPYGPLLRQCGWGPKHIIVFDLQTCEGAAFRPGGFAKADLNKHRIHVCVLFEAFLTWLYVQDLSDLDRLPDVVELDGVPFELYGYRRPGPGEATAGG
ncbi:hypothetical protein AB0M39_41495 [Streptomyces sp. NPDC051907]|uniref:hypothetical protein n=1 Tax=Streptomyces sp. NPDC051907 TaxID=3155284 RepID=UPI003420D34C